MTLDEKIKALSTNPAVPRLGVKGTGHTWKNSTDSPWEDLQVGKIKAMNATNNNISAGVKAQRNLVYGAASKICRSRRVGSSLCLPKYNHCGLVVHAPNADLVRDGAGPALKKATVKMLSWQENLPLRLNRAAGKHPDYWQTALDI